MKFIRLLKPVLLIYEVIRIMALIVIILIQTNDNIFLTKLAFTAPSALFPLMALFIWLNTERYREYLPLFTAGKCIGLFVLLGWSIIARQGKMTFELFLLFGDLFALSAVRLIWMDLNKMTEIKETPEITEDQ